MSSKNYYKFEINKGKFNPKYKNNIDYKNLPLRLKDFVFLHKNLEEIKEHKACSFIFFMEEHKRTKEYYYCPFTKKIIKKYIYINNSNSIDYNCVSCGKNIKINLNKIEIKDIICNICFKTIDLKNKQIKNELIKNLSKFSEYIKNILEKDRIRMLNYLKKLNGSKIYSRDQIDI